MTAGGRQPAFGALAAFLLSFALYLWCLAPSITFYDSGEFVTAVQFLGSAHSPGYPLFLLFAKPFTWLPFGNLAFRVNFATAVSAATACLAAYQLTMILLKSAPNVGDEAFGNVTRQLAALAAALLFATSQRLWLQSNHDKPYPLLAGICALILILLLRWKQAHENGLEQPAWWYATAFLAGLASGAHQTIVLFLPGCLLFVLVVAPGSIHRFRELVLSGAMLLFGAMVQLYLPLRAAAESRQNWGDPSTLERLLWHLLRKGYPEEPHARSFELLLKQLGAFDIPQEFGWLGLVLCGIGLWYCWNLQRAFAVCCITCLLSFWLVIVGYFNPQPESIFLTEEFYTPLYLLAAVVTAVGLYRLMVWGASSASVFEHYGQGHKALLAVFFLMLPTAQFFSNLPYQDQHANYLAQDYGMNTLRSLPEDTVLFTWGDSGAFPLWYLQGVERMREDVDLPHIPHLPFTWYQREMPRLTKSFGKIQVSMGAEQRFYKMAASLQRQRPLAVDYSTFHSLPWPSQKPMQSGIVYHLSADKQQLFDNVVWDLLTLHRMTVQGWHPDEDSQKAQAIHAYCLLQSAEDLAQRGSLVEAGTLLQYIETIMPAWQKNVQQLRQRYAIAAS